MHVRVRSKPSAPACISECTPMGLCVFPKSLQKRASAHKDTNMSENCLFCKIAAGEIPSTQVYSDEHIVAFRDISPAAPEHILLIPRKHIQSVAALSAQDGELMGHLMLRAKQIAEDEGIAESGYRCVMNTGQDGGQTVGHLHLHLLAGRQMTWPPG